MVAPEYTVATRDWRRPFECLGRRQRILITSQPDNGIAPRSYPARYHDGSTAETHHVSVHVQGSGLIVERSRHPAVVWKLRTIRYSEPTPENDVILFRRGYADRLILNDPDSLGHLGIRFKSTKHVWCYITTGIVACVLGSFILIERAPEWIVPFIPDHTEQWLGQQVAESIIAKKRVCTGKAGLHTLRVLERKIAHAAGINGSIHLDVIDDPQVNAFTMPGRRIVLLRGLIEASRTSDEVAGVMAHETGHVFYHDSMQLLVRLLGLSVLETVITGGSWSLSADLATQMLGLHYNRRQEERADKAAIRFLDKAGLRSDGLAHFFETLEKREEHSLSVEFLSDHPATIGRRHANPGSSSGASAMSDKDWQAVRRVCDEKTSTTDNDEDE
ncbi:Peptidase, M48 family [Granulibacter bethesdensis]|uniref:Peptidase, M48 family n=1 Tax=Granulibacter bethesdensis TaxID=364410 RepID=A0AAN0VFS1_9PROT|nr:Peptidase, M48 family [Granulibacter bethesdensis]